MRSFGNRNAGLTLIELLVTLAVLAIVATIAVPSFQEMIKGNRLVAQANAISGLISYVRSEASSKPDSFVSLCPSSNSSSCANGSQWESGWIAFRDADHNGAVDAGDEVLRVGQAFDGGNTLRVKGFSSSSLIQFDGSGQPVPSAGNPGAGTLIICDDRSASEAKAIVVNLSGQSRLVRDGKDHAGNAIACP